MGSRSNVKKKSEQYFEAVKADIRTFFIRIRPYMTNENGLYRFYETLIQAKDELMSTTFLDPNLLSKTTKYLRELITELKVTITTLTSHSILTQISPFLDFFTQFASPDFNFTPESLPNLIIKLKDALFVFTSNPVVFCGVILAINAFLLFLIFMDSAKYECMIEINTAIKNFLSIVNEVLNKLNSNTNQPRLH